MIYILGVPENSGPGDILGAITNQAQIAGEKIGNIETKGSVAKVKLPKPNVDSVIHDLKTIQNDPVLVGKEDSGRSLFLELSYLVEIEREEEMKRHRKEIKNMSGKKRERVGRALLYLKGKDSGTGLGDKILVKFSRQKKGESLPDTELGVGDLVMISKNNPMREDNPKGTIAKKTNYSITVAFDKKPPSFVYGKRLRCDLFVNDITYQRQLEALKKAYKGKGKKLNDLVKKSIGEKILEKTSIEKKFELLDKKLNDSQKKAVKNALRSNDFHLIHGPPGTGKTITCVEISRQLVQRDEDVLCTADSNTAVDNMVEEFANKGEKVVRIGHPARVTPTLRNHTLDELIKQNEKYKESKRLREKAEGLMNKQEEFTHPSGRWRRGMSDERIKSLAKKEKGSRGVPPQKIKKMAKWLKYQEKINQLFKKIDSLENEAIEEILDWADIVCATNSGCGSELLSDKNFDCLIIDEATQATEPSCWIPITLAKKVIMAGDHKQLPPTILSKKAKELSHTLFERLLKNHDSKIKNILKIQYRMNKKIMQFPNREFYNGELKADKTVADHTIEDLLDQKINSSDLNKSINPKNPLLFINTEKFGHTEKSRKGSTSKENPKEAKIIHNLVENFLKIGLNPTDIAIISPYDDQVDLLFQKIDVSKVEIDTVDGFQGREKELIILSLVRSNKNNNIGFLEDIRRLNVSITRAKRKLIILGDYSTINSHSTYSKLLEYISKNGKIIKSPA